jgi:hypothetical protein
MSSCIVSFKNQVVFVWWFASALSIEFIFACRASWCGLIPLFRKGLAHEMQILWFDSEMRKPAGIVKICEAEINWGYNHRFICWQLRGSETRKKHRVRTGHWTLQVTQGTVWYVIGHRYTTTIHDHFILFHTISRICTPAGTCNMHMFVRLSLCVAWRTCLEIRMVEK